MPTVNNEIVVVIGAGKVGLSIAGKLNKHSRLALVIGRKPSALENLEAFPVIKFSDSIRDIPKNADLIIVAINDSFIDEIDSELARLGLLSNCIIAHTSGIYDRLVLKKCFDIGLKTASLHPYQTFFSPNPDLLNSIAWGIDCDMDDYEFLANIIQSLDGKPFLLDNSIPEFKALYHSSAVVASNYVTLLLTLAGKIAKSAGIPSKEFLRPIVYQTIGNFFNSKDVEIPLTGPIARGDIETIQKHISALKQHHDLLVPYVYSALGAAETAHNNGILNQENYNRIMLFLKETLKENESTY